MILICVVIFVHPIDDNFGNNLAFLSSYWSKIMERKNGREGIRMSSEHERESCPKIVTRWLCKYHFSDDCANMISLLIFIQSL